MRVAKSLHSLFHDAKCFDIQLFLHGSFQICLICMCYQVLDAKTPFLHAYFIVVNGRVCVFSSYLADKEASDKRKLVRKWHRTTKGTLRRNYRVPSTSVGRRLLKAVASLLSEDDHFRDATSHKVIQNFVLYTPFLFSSENHLCNK